MSQTASSTDAGFWGSNFSVWAGGANGYGSAMIIWGTEGIMGSFIVLSASESQRIEEINIAQGAGFTAIVVLLMDGLDVNIEVIDDTSLYADLPALGVAVQIITPFGSAPMLLVKNEANQAPKREGHRSFTFKSFSGITGLH